jgi:uncharacterized protein (TIGR02300 family)
VAKPELGTKRTCQNCSSKFYDLGRDPITCPKCGSIFQIMLARGTRATAETADDELDIDPMAAAAIMIPLEDVDVADDDKAILTDDIELDDDVVAGDDDTFLEPEEDDNDNVADLIDGDIGEDEES